MCAASLVLVGPGVAATTGDQPSSASSPIGRVYLTKTCDAAFPTIPICTVQASDAGPLPVGTEAYYSFAVLDFEKLRSAGVILTTPGGDTAAGHCTLSFKTGLWYVYLCAGGWGAGRILRQRQGVIDPTTGVTIWDGCESLCRSRLKLERHPLPAWVVRSVAQVIENAWQRYMRPSIHPIREPSLASASRLLPADSPMRRAHHGAFAPAASSLRLVLLPSAEFATLLDRAALGLLTVASHAFRDPLQDSCVHSF